MNKSKYNELLAQLMEYYNQDAPNFAARVVNKTADDVIEVYKKKYEELFYFVVNELYGSFGTGSDKANIKKATSLMLQIEERLREIDRVLELTVIEAIHKNYITGQVDHALANERVNDINDLKEFVPHSTINTYTLEQLIGDTMDDLLSATNNTSRGLKKVIRDVFAKHTQLAALDGTTHKELIRIINKELSKDNIFNLVNNGFLGIIDKAGRKWNLKTYITMVINTKLHAAHVEGLKDRAQDTGRDLAVISRKGSKDPCRHFEGMIISLSGNSKKYYSYDQLKASGLVFHPNCRHTVIPIPSADLMGDEALERHKLQMAEIKKISKNKLKK